MQESKNNPDIEREIELYRANLVILARAHNPSILSPDWVAKYCGLDEEAGKFIHTPDFSMFDCDSLQIVLDQARMQVNSKQIDPLHLEKSSGFVCRYIETLPHVPYLAAGFNYSLRWKDASNKREKISTTIGGKPVPGDLQGYRTFSGGVLYGEQEDHRMKLVMEVASENEMFFNFNFHYEIKDSSNKEIISIISNFPEKAVLSAEMVKTLIE